jgi:uncharacterized protein (TIGR01244 family)
VLVDLARTTSRERHTRKPAASFEHRTLRHLSVRRARTSDVPATARARHKSERKALVRELDEPMQSMDVPTMPKHLALLVLLALPLSCQFATDDAASVDSVDQPMRSADLGEMHCVAIDGAAWIGGYPTAQDLDLARRRGVQTAIDVSTSDETASYDIGAACRTLGIEYVSLGVETKRAIDDDNVERVLAELRQRARESMVFFCADGSRAAMLYAIHRAVDDGVPVEDALVEARRAGMKPGRQEAFVRTEVLRLAPNR